MTITQESHRDLYVTWPEYYKLGERLAALVEHSKWEFDQITCIARGGMFIGDMLSRVFQKPLAIISSSSYSGKEKKQIVISKHIAMTTDTLGKRILLVDDLVDSGDSLQMIKQELQEKYGVLEVKTAVLWHKTCSSYNPDFSADHTIGKETWIHQPFEVYDHFKNDSSKDCH